MAIALVVIAVLAAVIAVVVASPIEPSLTFHVYADRRTLAGIPHAGDVLSNLAFLAGAWWFRRSLPASLGVAAIGIGSGIYHWAPGPTTLVLDWSAIVVTLMLVTAAVIRDRIGPRAGLLALAIGPLLGVGTVGYWLLTNDLVPYVVVQLVGVALPPLLALVAPGRIAARWLLAATGCFGLARLCAAHDAAILDAVGLSGHSFKHLAAALAATCALRALHPPQHARNVAS